jgi:uncharacterized protein YbjT (DUF2867 family)
MKIIVTGSLGNISKPLTISLLQNGHEVTVISSTEDRKQEIEKLGATAAIGSLQEAGFLTNTFSNADAVYCMVPPNNYFEHNLDLIAYYRNLAHLYFQAIKQSGIKRVVNLSSIGANLTEGNGILRGAHDVEQILNELPEDVAITHLRPTSFYYNLYAYTEMIKSEGIIAANYGAADIVPWVSPIDIASAAFEELELPLAGRKVRYVCSEELSCNTVAEIIGKEIGKPDLKWIVVSDDEMFSGLKTIGMNPQIAAGLVEMYSGLHNGLLAEDYFKHRPTTFGKVKMTDFAKEFASTYLHK